MKMQHFIVTRLMLNIREKKNQKYLDSRAKIFNDFYVRSMLSQTNKNFENIILIDPIYKNLDYSLFNFKSLNHKICYVDNPRKINYLEQKQSDYILTTRMDSDDIISDNFVKNIQDKFLFVNDECIIDHKWLFFISENKKSVTARNYNCNSMFLTTAIRPKDYFQKGCYSAQHGAMPRKFAKKIIIDDYGSACICHGTNISNRIGSGKALPNLNTKKYFSWI